MINLKELTFKEIGSKRDENGYAILDDIAFEGGIGEPRGTNERTKKWYSCKDGQIMIKTNTDYNENAAYSELISCELAKQAGIETAEYDMVSINGEKGIITKNMCQPGEELVSIRELLEKYDEDEEIEDSKKSCSKEINEQYADITDIDVVFKKLVKAFYKNKMLDKEKTFELLLDLKKRMLFDLCIMETDRHVENISFIFGSDETGQRTIRLAPMYDTEAALCLYADNMKGIYSNYAKASNIANMQEPKIGRIPEIVEEEAEFSYDLTDPNAFLLSLQSKVSQSYYSSANEEMWKSTLDFLCDDQKVKTYYSRVLSKMDIAKAQKAVESRIGVELSEDIKKMSEVCFESRKGEIAWELDLDYEKSEGIKSNEEFELT